MGYIQSNRIYGADMPYLKKVIPVPEPIDCRILTAALDLFVTRGFHNVSIHDVQKMANVSIGSIYNHFGGKEGIAKALYTHLLNEINEMIDSVQEELSSPVAQCNRVIELLFEYTETKTHIISFILYSKHSEYIQDGTPICSAEPFQRLRNIIQAGMDQDEIKKTDLLIASSVIFGGAIRMIHLRLDGLVTKPLPHFYEEVISATWSSLSVKPETKLDLESVMTA